MKVAILVPRRPEPWRDQLWSFVQGYTLAGCAARALDWPLVEGLDGDPATPFNRAAAINRAADLAEPWNFAVILDADTLVDLDLVVDVVRRLDAGEGGWGLPHTAFRSLTRAATRDVLASRTMPDEAAVRWVTPMTKSSCVCVTHELWSDVSGFDPAFVGWGFEDAAFYAAAGALGGDPLRVDGAVTHLWHPRSPEKNETSAAYRANRALAERYKAAARVGGDAVRDLLDELRGVPS